MKSARELRYPVPRIAPVAILLAVVHAGCTRQDAPPSASAGAGNPTGTGGAGGGDISGQGAATTGGGAPAEPEPCRWEGWYRAPRLPSGCTGLCIPDRVEERVPHLTWSERPDWCVGCRSLDTPWATTDAARRDAVGTTVRGQGPAASAVALNVKSPDGGIPAIFSSSGAPLAAWRTDYEQDEPCGRLWGLLFDTGSSIGAWYTSTLDAPYTFLKVPASGIRDLMTSVESSFEWSPTFTRGRGINDLWFNESLVAADFSGSIGIGNFATGVAIEINKDATGLGGAYNEVQLAGTTAFVSRYMGYRTDWFIVEGNTPRPFLGDEEHDIDFLTTDGDVFVFKQGVDPYPNPDGYPPILYRRYDLYRAPYTSNPADLAPRLLLPDVPPGLYHALIQNGYLVADYLTTLDPAPRESAALVVRIEDGRAWRTNLNEYSWGAVLYPAATELWGTVTRYYAADTYETVARVPYDQLDLIQEAAPP